MQPEDFSKIAFQARTKAVSGPLSEGLKWTLAGHAVLAIVTLTFALLYVTLLQLCYLLPLARVFYSLDRRRSIQGVAVGALAGLLINGAYLLIISYANRGHPW